MQRYLPIHCVFHRRRVPRGNGQALFRQALVLADHNAYSLGQLVDQRRTLKIWPESSRRTPPSYLAHNTSRS